MQLCFELTRQKITNDPESFVYTRENPTHSGKRCSPHNNGPRQTTMLSQEALDWIYSDDTTLSSGRNAVWFRMPVALSCMQFQVRPAATLLWGGSVA